MAYFKTLNSPANQSRALLGPMFLKAYAANIDKKETSSSQNIKMLTLEMKQVKVLI